MEHPSGGGAKITWPISSILSVNKKVLCTLNPHLRPSDLNEQEGAETRNNHDTDDNSHYKCCGTVRLDGQSDEAGSTFHHPRSSQNSDTANSIDTEEINFERSEPPGGIFYFIDLVIWPKPSRVGVRVS